MPSESDTGTAPSGDELARRLGDLARSLEQLDDLQATLTAIVQAAVRLVPGAAGASISSVRARRQVRTLAATGELSLGVDRAQYDAAQGPCLDVLYSHRSVRVADMATEQRWPVFSEQAAALGVGSMLAVQLYVEGDDMGALNLIGAEPGAFTDASEHVALLFASHAAIAMAGAEERSGLEQALGTRDLIGQAKGVLMERLKVDAEVAFATLVRASQASNRRLLTVAQELAETGVLAAGPSLAAPTVAAPTVAAPTLAAPTAAVP